MDHAVRDRRPSAEVLAFDIENMDRPHRRVRVCRKGGAVDVIAAPAPGTDIGRVIQRVITRLVSGKRARRAAYCSSRAASSGAGSCAAVPAARHLLRSHASGLLLRITVLSIGSGNDSMSSDSTAYEESAPRGALRASIVPNRAGLAL